MTDPRGRPAVMEDLFEPEPVQWGLRGDPYAWRAMRDLVAGVAVPTDADRLRTLLTDAFTSVVGLDLDDPGAPETVHRPELAHGGMSSGAVCLPVWRERLLHLLLERGAAVRPERG